MIKKSDIFTTIREHSDEIKQLGVKRLGVFGSVARNEASRKSDIDVLVEFCPKQKTFNNYMKLKYLLQKTLKRKVDLVTKPALKSQLKSTIEKDLTYAGF